MSMHHLASAYMSTSSRVSGLSCASICLMQYCLQEKACSSLRVDMFATVVLGLKGCWLQRRLSCVQKDERLDWRAPVAAAGDAIRHHRVQIGVGTHHACCQADCQSWPHHSQWQVQSAVLPRLVAFFLTSASFAHCPHKAAAAKHGCI